MLHTKQSHDFLYVLQQGQIQVLLPWFGQEGREGHERNFSTGLTDQTTAQEGNGLRGTLGRRGRWKEGVGKR